VLTVYVLLRNSENYCYVSSLTTKQYSYFQLQTSVWHINPYLQVENTFEPEGAIIRTEFVTVLPRVMKVPVVWDEPAYFEE